MAIVILTQDPHTNVLWRSAPGAPMVVDGPLIGVITDIEDISPGAITSFMPCTASVELGATLNSPAFVATYLGTVVSATLTDDDGNPAKNVTPSPTSFSSDASFQKTTNNDSVEFTLSAIVNGGAANATADIFWRPRTYSGVVAQSTLLSEAQIEGLVNTGLDDDYTTSFSVSAPGAGDYVWYCFPQAYDPTDSAVFQVGLFVGGFMKIGVQSVTNTYGVTQDYACWRSNNPGLGPITVQVT